jgi:hypothetical protein
VIALALSLLLIWNLNDPSESVTNYYVYHTTNLINFNKIGETSSNQFQIVKEPGAHFYAVTALNSWGESTNRPNQFTPQTAQRSIMQQPVKLRKLAANSLPFAYFESNGLSAPVASYSGNPFVRGNQSIVTESFLDALALVESSRNAAVISDGGRARGPFQIWRGAWQDADRKLKLHKSYELYATNPAVSRLYARAILTTLEPRLAAALGCPPTPEQLYAAWNLGLTGFERRGFLLSQCPQSTQRAARKLKSKL